MVIDDMHCCADLEIQSAIDACKPPFVEIGGPSPGGYAFVAKIGARLPRNIRVTNVANPIVIDPYGDDRKEYFVGEEVDIRTVHYAAGSIGMILASSLPLYPDHNAELKQRALREYDLDPKELVVDRLVNLHLVLLVQAKRLLHQKGVLIIENTRPPDTRAALRLGFDPLMPQKLEDAYHSQIYINT